MKSYFTSKEFDSPLQPGSGVNMKQSTLSKLNTARHQYGKPIVVTNGFRVKADYIRLKALGYKPAKNSAHFTGHAVDIRPKQGLTALLQIKDVNQRKLAATEWKLFFQSLWDAGFRRFGIMNNVIHVDDDPTKSSPALWKYNNTDNEVWRLVSLWYNSNLKSIK